MVFQTKVFRTMKFYIKTEDPEFNQAWPDRQGMKAFEFVNGLFDTEDVLDLQERAAVEKKLAFMVENPGLSGLMVYGDDKGKPTCPDCGKGFASQAALTGHSRIHKTELDIKTEAEREGATPVSRSE